MNNNNNKVLTLRNALVHNASVKKEQGEIVMI